MTRRPPIVGGAGETWGRAFLTHRALSTDPRDGTDARGDGISWSFVHKNSSLRFVHTFFCTTSFVSHFARTAARRVDFRHLRLPQFYGIAKKQIVYIPADCLSPIVEFCEQSNLNPLTRTQVHGYILQVVRLS